MKSLTERFVDTGVHEDIERCVESGEVLAGLKPDEARIGQPSFQISTLRAVPDDDNSDPIHPCNWFEQFNLLFLGQTADIPDDDLIIRCEETP